MASNEEEKVKFNWKKFAKKNWKVFAAFITACIVAFIGALLVIKWFMDTSTLGGQGNWTFDQFSLENVVGFMMLLTVWELLFVGVPALVFFGVFGYLWWRNLSTETKEEFKEESKKKNWKSSNTTRGGGGSFFMFIVFIIVVAIEGKWGTGFSLLPYSYFVWAYFRGFLWTGIIIGIPIVIAVTVWYLTKKSKKEE
ncbi:hypothetical protein LCGC14_0791360 [marine sediment metagenome]|uniref:Uncharacterized protein n=1 Tax=marine sediment metagenome TaxID=412755 RepID=A0A0F9QC84_9ZZZZ|nr:MAG: hypothetical protein Lokiarch_21530 [Candidatus Lokiarchaeum sp. GC14_75]HEC39157.1 hypothetical protein [bacterium]